MCVYRSGTASQTDARLSLSVLCLCPDCALSCDGVHASLPDQHALHNANGQQVARHLTGAPRRKQSLHLYKWRCSSSCHLSEANSKHANVSKSRRKCTTKQSSRCTALLWASRDRRASCAPHAVPHAGFDGLGGDVNVSACSSEASTRYVDLPGMGLKESRLSRLLEEVTGDPMCDDSGEAESPSLS